LVCPFSALLNLRRGGKNILPNSIDEIQLTKEFYGTEAVFGTVLDVKQRGTGESVRNHLSPLTGLAHFPTFDPAACAAGFILAALRGFTMGRWVAPDRNFD
jgi:hypothetical protein